MAFKYKNYKTCFVPTCRNTTITAPEAIFIAVPRTRKQRIRWFRMANKFFSSSSEISTNTAYYCCHEHFNLEEDMENFVKFKLTGCRLVPKEGVVPHIFKCQNREPTKKKCRSLIAKKAKNNSDDDESYEETPLEIKEEPEEPIEMTMENSSYDDITSMNKNSENEENEYSHETEEESIEEKWSIDQDLKYPFQIKVDKDLSPTNDESKLQPGCSKQSIQESSQLPEADLQKHNETEFDLWAKSLAMQLNSMEVSRALKLQLRLQTVITEERLNYESGKIV